MKTLHQDTKRTATPAPVQASSRSSTSLNVLQRILVRRGVSAGSEPLALNQLLDWRRLLHIDAATDILVAALQQKQHILIVGDYDADGATGVALGMDVLARLGAEKVSFLVPNRFEHSYGLTPELVKIAQSSQPDLIVTVDNGTTSVEGVAYANACGIPVLITDHHLTTSELPKAKAVVNPNQPGCDFPSKNLAGVGVMFYVLMALRAKLRDLGWFQDRAEPNLAQGLDLVAIGTIADLVPLDYNNRCLVQQGLMRIRTGHARRGITALMHSAKINLERSTSSDLAFRLIPRLNAAGRMQDMGCGIRCLLADTADEADALAAELNHHNFERRKVGAAMEEDAGRILHQILGQVAQLPDGICLANETWHLGLIGIVAARVRDRCRRPALILAPASADAPEGLWKGSARSLPGIHLLDLLLDIDARHPDVLTSFGGHAMAAGVSVKKEQIALLTKAFASAARRVGVEQHLQDEMVTDGELAADELSLATAVLLTQASPWGKGFPVPLFQGEFNLGQASFFGDRLLRLRVQPIDTPGLWLKAVSFDAGAAGWPAKTKRARLLYELGIESYRGMESMQLIIRHRQQS